MRTPEKTAKILNLSTHNEPCGIAKYQESFVQSLNRQGLANADFFEISPNIFKNQSEAEKQKSLAQMKHILKEYDVLHIQHEFSFFNENDFARFVKQAQTTGKKIVLTMHTPPSLVWAKPYSPRVTGMSSLRANKAAKKKIASFNSTFVNPLMAADCIICHNKIIAKELIELGVNSEAIRFLPLPIPNTPEGISKNNMVKNHFRKSEDDVLLAVVGFIGETKGIHHAIDALSFLPNNFKLAIIGGLHPSHSHVSDYLQQLLDQVIKRGLQSRFYMTGYIQDDSKLIQTVSEYDICLFPYDVNFYRAVTSASINTATASHTPAIAFPTPAFEEIRHYNKSVQVCGAANSYELAREIKAMNIEENRIEAIKYSQENSYDVIAAKLAKLYSEIASRRD
jgi:glycosyltransferase involved in cell wall biosynthesis